MIPLEILAEHIFFDECWLWTGPFYNSGTPRIIHNGKDFTVSRVLYTQLIDLNIKGKVLKNVCAESKCVNPMHKMPLSKSEFAAAMTINIRGMQRKKQTHCRRGHEFTGDNIYIKPSDGKRECVICKRKKFKINLNKGDKK